ncbi:MAG: ABC transporter ATP-binding protein [Armatimonadetes bacterium]|nr:ABC transporter ATP-binding protein [Armatimonadota bacterium]
MRNAVVSFRAGDGRIRALDDVSLNVEKGETIAVVGESGCGKTTLARSVLGLQRLDSGSITLDGKPVDGVKAGQAATVGMVWQDPFASLDPRWRIKDIVKEPVSLARSNENVGQVLRDVGLDEGMAERYPHQLSGGQRQRVAIGRALALRPPLVICDEPTAALDLSMQAQVLNLLRDLQASIGCAFLYISHDLTTVRFLADRVAVMYVGQIVEFGPTEDVFNRPMHPYTAALMASAPTLDRLGHLPDPAEGEVPDPRSLGIGCRFAGRCPRVEDICRAEKVPPIDRGAQVALCRFPIE